MTEYEQYIIDTKARIDRMMERPDIYYCEINAAQHDLRDALECCTPED